MKKILTLCFSFIFLFLCSCKDELCYDCKKSGGDQARFCLPRKDAKNARDRFEQDGYSCKKFSQ